MAWRPTNYLIEGELDNTTPGKVTGWMRFAGIQDRITFDLNGNFHRDIRGARIRFHGDGDPRDAEAVTYMDGFAFHQTGNAGDITAGREPHDYVRYPYVEWWSHENGRVVIELTADRVEVVGTPIPACELDPISREEQARNMTAFLTGVSEAIGARVVAVGPGTTIRHRGSARSRAACARR